MSCEHNNKFGGKTKKFGTINDVLKDATLQ